METENFIFLELNSCFNSTGRRNFKVINTVKSLLGQGFKLCLNETDLADEKRLTTACLAKYDKSLIPERALLPNEAKPLEEKPTLVLHFKRFDSLRTGDSPWYEVLCNDYPASTSPITQ